MLNVEVLVGELLTVDRDTTCSVMVGEVTALGHEVLDDTVQGGAFVRVFLLVVTGAKGSEVFCGLGDIVSVELNINKIFDWGQYLLRI